MKTTTTLQTLALLLLVLFGFLGGALPTQASELTGCFEEAQQGVFDAIDDFAVSSCEPACTGQICCGNGACVNSVLACGDMFGALPSSFRTIGTSRSQLAGAATGGVLAAAQGGKANVWIGEIAGDGWRALGVEPGTYQLILEENATAASATVKVVDRDEREVARLPATVKVLEEDGGVGLACDWGTDGGCLFILCCHNGVCKQVSICSFVFG